VSCEKTEDFFAGSIYKLHHMIGHGSGSVKKNSSKVFVEVVEIEFVKWMGCPKILLVRFK